MEIGAVIYEMLVAPLLVNFQDENCQKTASTSGSEPLERLDGD